jgi:hypothetical protein
MKPATQQDPHHPEQQQQQQQQQQRTTEEHDMHGERADSTSSTLNSCPLCGGHWICVSLSQASTTF